MTADAKSPRRKRTVLEVLGQIRQPKVAVMLALGFASGLPFLLTQNTLGYWLRDEGTMRSLSMADAASVASSLHQRQAA